jgi:ketosteroid isomerase-like protein
MMVKIHSANLEPVGAKCGRRQALVHWKQGALARAAEGVITMSTESNKQLVRDTWGAVTNAEIDKFLDGLADDVTWTFFGSHRFAGTFNGKDDLMARLFSPLGEVLEGGIVVNINSMTAEDDRVVIEAKGTARSKSGADYNNDYCIVITVANNKIRHVREYLDSELVTTVFGK